MCELSISDPDVPLCDKEECRISWRKSRYKFPTSCEPDIIELYRREGLCRSFYDSSFSVILRHEGSMLWIFGVLDSSFVRMTGTTVFPCYDSDFSSCKINLRNTLSCEGLISRCSHLVLTWEIDPELDCMLDATSARELLGHELIVHEPTPSSHPLDLIGTDHSPTTSGILMFDLSRVDYRHCLESSMWMETNSRTISINLRRYTPWSIVV